jgi:hypothetical protein
MNLFGAFNFGRLIKTFLPGFVILIGLCLVIDSSIVLATSNRLFLKWIERDAVLLTLISIPLSLICGIVSNMVCFTFVTDKLIRLPYNRENAALNNLQESVSNWVNEHCASKDKLNPTILNEFKNYFDLEYFLLPIIKLEKLSYLQESYWYYLEFQLNITLASIFFALAAISWSALYFPVLGLSCRAYLCLVVAFSSLVAFVALLSVKAARLNYDRHRRKLISFLIGTIYTPNNGK